MKVISTKKKGWQKLSWELAHAGVAFEVPDIQPKHILFFQRLCAAYRCEYKVLGNKHQLFSPSLITKGMNDEIEAELKRLLRKLSDSKKKPDKELMGMWTHYIALCEAFISTVRLFIH